MERAQEAVLSDVSDSEEGGFGLDSNDSFDDDFNSDEDNEQSVPGDQLEELENIESGNIHSFHSCSCCSFIDFDSEKSSQAYLWAKLRAHPSDALEDCEFFRFCREQYVHFPDSAALYICVELKDGRHFSGSEVGFTFSIGDRIWPGQRFLRGRVHSSEWLECCG